MLPIYEPEKDMILILKAQEQKWEKQNTNTNLVKQMTMRRRSITKSSINIDKSRQSSLETLLFKLRPQITNKLFQNNQMNMNTGSSSISNNPYLSEQYPAK